MYDAEKNFTWNKLSELNMIATLKLCAVRVYVMKARCGSEDRQ
jgi:hypothetical protein